MSNSSHTSNTINGQYAQEVAEGTNNKLEFSEDEEALIARMFRLVGERWSLIAGRIPGRTAEEIEKYWNSKCSSWSITTSSQRP